MMKNISRTDAVMVQMAQNGTPKWLQEGFSCSAAACRNNLPSALICISIELLHCIVLMLKASKNHHIKAPYI